jgi:hypothetical protein
MPSVDKIDSSLLVKACGTYISNCSVKGYITQESIFIDAVHSGSKLLSAFPWPIIFRPKAIKQNCLRNMKI